MKLLIIGTDTKLFDQKSDVRNRSLYFSECFDEYTVIVASSRAKHTSEFSIGPNKNANFISVYGKIKPILFLKSLLVAVKYAKKSDIISSQDAKEIGLIAYISALIRRKKFHIQIHTDVTLSPLSIFLLKRAHRVRVVAHFIKEKIQSFTRCPIDVLPVYIDKNKYKNALPDNTIRDIIPDTDFLVLLMSRFEKEKNIYSTIDILGSLEKQLPRLSIVVVGDGSQREILKSLVKEKRFNRIAFVPWTNSPESFYKAANIFVSLSLFEGYGMTIVESLLAGTPVLTTNVGVAGDHIHNNVNSWIVDKDDKALIVSIINKIYKDKQYYETIKTNLSSVSFDLFPSKAEYRNLFLKMYKMMLK